jgi:hypothetical protein
LVEEMVKLDVGHLQVDNNLRWTIRTASTWQTEEGQHFRIATNRPIRFGEYWRGLKTYDYPIGILEFVLPPEGKGEGSLMVATKILFNKKGQIEIRSLPKNTSPERLTNVVRRLPEKTEE